MATPYALLAVSDDDRDEAAAVAYVVQHGGWRVRSVDPAEISPELGANMVGQANAVILVWAANSAAAPMMAVLAKAAAASGKLVSVRLDHSVLPVGAHGVIDASGWRDQPSAAGRAQLLQALSQCAERSGDAPGFARKARPSMRVPIAAGLALGLVGIAALAAIGANILEARNEKAARDLATAQAPGMAPSMAPSMAAPGLRPAAGARDRELDAWRAVLAAQGAAETLAALARYKDGFPDGAMMAQAKRIENIERGTVERVQKLLISRGFLTTDAPGDIGRATISAAAAFQARHDLPVDGRITPDLVIALERAPPAPQAQTERSALP